MNKRAGLVMSSVILVAVFLAGVYFGAKWAKSGKVDKFQSANDEMRARLAAFVSFVQEGKAKPEAASEAQKLCEELGGRWGMWGTRNKQTPAYSCNLPTSDAGKACTDSRECESLCIAAPSALLGENSDGRCYEFLYPTKCVKVVENRIFTKEICPAEKSAEEGEDGNQRED